MSSRPARWGFIGLGLLGSQLATRVRDQGIAVFGFDVDRSACQSIAGQGVEVGDSPDQVALSCSLISLCLPNANAVRLVVESIGDHWRPGTIVLDHSTLSPDQCVEIASLLANRGVTYLEANVAGSSRLAGAGLALFLCAGDQRAFEEVRPNLARLSERIYYLGSGGSAARMKLVFNHLLGLNRAVLAEALGFAAAQGVDLSRALEVLKAANDLLSVASTKGEKMIRRDFAPQARLAQHRKDIGLILAEAKECGAWMPLEELHAQILDQALEAGCGTLDNSSIIMMFLPADESTEELGDSD